MGPHPDDDAELGGDPACWLDQVCEACGALVEDEEHACGADGRSVDTR